MATLREKLNGTIGVFLFFNTPEAKNKLYITVSRKILKYHHYEQTEKLFVFLDNRTEMIRYYSLDQVCNFSFYEENMNNKLEIEIPEGMCIDREHSTFEKIVFKPVNTKPRSWKEYCKLKKENLEHGYIIDDADTRIAKVEWEYVQDVSTWRNVLPSEELAEAFLALCH